MDSHCVARQLATWAGQEISAAGETTNIVYRARLEQHPRLGTVEAKLTRQQRDVVASRWRVSAPAVEAKHKRARGCPPGCAPSRLAKIRDAEAEGPRRCQGWVERAVTINEPGSAR
jgi:hypothetical protein